MSTFANGSSQCGMTGFRTFTGEGVTLVDLLKEANVTVSADDYFLLDTSDHYGNNFTYEELFGTTRYFLQGIYDDDFYEQYKALVGSDDEAGSTIELRKLLAAKALEDESTVEPRINVSYVETIISGDDLADAVLPTEENTEYNSLVNYENQYRFFYGIAIVQDDCTVTFDSQGGSEVEAQVVLSHPMTSTSNTTIKSSYWANSLVIYRGKGADYPATEASTAAETITKPENPTKEGYTFMGWYTDAECTDGNEFDFTANDGTVDVSTTLYAKWVVTKNGFILEDGQYNYYVDDVLMSDYTGIVKDAIDGTTAWYYVKNGVYDSTAKGLAKKADGSAATWYYVQDGKYVSTAEGLAQKADGSATTWYYVSGGKYVSGVKTVCSKADGSSSKLFYVKNSRFASQSTGTVTIDGVKYIVTNGIAVKA